ncbi:MAG: hypothetical protein ACM3ZQ_02880 [Bacillota bacterium]
MAKDLRNDGGQGLIEYAFIIGLVALTAIVGLAKIAEPSTFPLQQAVRRLSP